MNWKSFAKALVAAVVGILLAGADIIASGHIDVIRLRALAAGAVTAAAVYLTPNAAPAPAAANVEAALALLKLPAGHELAKGDPRAPGAPIRPLTPAEARWGVRP